MNRAVKSWAAVLGVASVATVGAATTPYALRRVDAFGVGRIELVGARYLTPEQAAHSSGITPSATLFDDLEPWRRALERHPLVLSAEVHRRLPDVVIFEVVETEPIALVGTPELQPVDARGALLPIDPARFELDLPLLSGDARADSGRLAGADTRRALDALRRVRDAEPWLASWTSELDMLDAAVRLRLRWPAGAEVLLPASPDAARLHEVRLAVADLIANGSPSGGERVAGTARVADAAPDAAFADTELARLVRLDARYRDQVVVRLAERGARARMREAT